MEIWIWCVQLFLVLGFFCRGISAEYKLTILHTGDVRSHFEAFNNQDKECSQEDKNRNECFGGWARFDTLVNGYRKMMDNMLLLESGNQFHGTTWFTVYRDEATSYFMNRTGYDAMGLGHHEFNLKPSGLAHFADDATFPILSCNIDDSAEPVMTDKYKKYTILTVGGQRIGIVGFTYWNTAEIANAGDIKFLDEVDSLKTATKELLDLGVNKIIALGRSTFDINMKVAQEVPGIDIVVSGDTYRFLYTGTPPSNERPTDPYPVVIQPDHDTDNNVLLVQTFLFGKYVGHLDVTFDDEGRVFEWDGNPVLLDTEVEEDPDTKMEIEEWAKKVNDYNREHLGDTNVLLEAISPSGFHDNSPCRYGECSMGNMLTDALVHQHFSLPTENQWTDVAIAILNAGAMRQTLDIGDIVRGDLLEVLPYLSSIDTLDLEGQYILEALEHSVAGYDSSAAIMDAKFLQFSGIKVVYNISKPDGQRVGNVSVLCADCEIPEYVPLNVDKIYRILTTNFIADGGDNYDMIAEHKMNHETGRLDTDILEEYIKQMSPLYHGRTGRIRFTHEKDPPCAYGRAEGPNFISTKVVMLSVLLAFVLNHQ